MFLSRAVLLVLLVQVALLIPANYLLVLYLSTPEIEGPFGIFSWIRSRAGIRPVTVTDMDTGEQEVVGYDHNGNFFAQMLSCHRCFSPWSSAGLIIMSWLIGFIEPDPANIIIWLSVAGATVFLLE